MKFRAAKQNRIFQDVVDQIQEAILNRELKPGDQLPPERELKKMFHTSRGTLREALRVLEQKGLIEIRLGASGGAVVKDAPTELFSEGLDLLIRFQKIPLSHLAEFREEIEGAVAALAAERITADASTLLNGLVEEARKRTASGLSYWQEFLEIDKQIHQEIAKISGNLMYILIHQIIHENIHRYYDQYLPADQAVMEKNYEDLRNLVNAVNENNIDVARALAQEHIRWFSKHMAENAGINALISKKY